MRLFCTAVTAHMPAVYLHHLLQLLQAQERHVRSANKTWDKPVTKRSNPCRRDHEEYHKKGV